MTTTPYQPTLPAEVPFTDAELNFMEESPPGLFPENQNSNFGYAIRKIFSDQMQAAIDQVETLYTERFIDSASLFLDRWEADYGLPVAPTGKSISERRSMVESRIQIGSFSRERVNGIIESYLNATAGETVSLTPEGVAMPPGGVPLFGEFTPGQALYRVYEDIQNFTYTVWILNSITPDIPGMTRELARITPSGIQFTTDNTKTNVLDYLGTVKNKQPVAHFWLGNNQDISGYANNLTVAGGATFGNASALLQNTGNTAIDLNGTAHYMTAAHAAQLNVGDNFSLEAWIRPDAIGSIMTFLSKGTNAFDLAVEASGKVALAKQDTAIVSRSTTVLTAGVTYHVVAIEKFGTSRIYINGVNVSESAAPHGYAFADTASLLNVGRRQGTNDRFFNGVMDEVAIYNYALSDSEILENYRTGMNLA